MSSTKSVNYVEFVAVFSEYEESGLLETDEVKHTVCQLCDSMLVVISRTAILYLVFLCSISRQPWTQVKW